MSMIHKDNLEIGTKVYRYTLNYEEEGCDLLVKEGEVVEKVITNIRGEIYRVDKMIVFDKRDRVYFTHKNDQSIPIDECYSSRVLLLEDDPQRAKELFIEYEENKIAALYEEIDRHKEKLAKMEGK